MVLLGTEGMQCRLWSMRNVSMGDRIFILSLLIQRKSSIKLILPELWDMELKAACRMRWKYMIEVKHVWELMGCLRNGSGLIRE